MLRPLRKANAETRRVLNKALKTEAHSPLCKLYIYIYIYFFFFFSWKLHWKMVKSQGRKWQMSTVQCTCKKKRHKNNIFTQKPSRLSIQQNMTGHWQIWRERLVYCCNTNWRGKCWRRHRCIVHDCVSQSFRLVSIFLHNAWIVSLILG